MRNIPKFQFHTGSIKRQPNEIPKEAVYMFQFHTGSIKSEPDPKNPLYPPKRAFQFHTGSIKRKNIRKVSFCCYYLFQFHTGSIKREHTRRGRIDKLFNVSIPYWFD